MKYFDILVTFFVAGIVFLVGLLFLNLRNEHINSPARIEKKEPLLQEQSKKMFQVPVSQVSPAVSQPTEVKSSLKVIVDDVMKAKSAIKQPFQKVIVNSCLSKTLKICSPELDKKLDEPVLSSNDYQWCLDQINPNKGGVIVGKSWGKLKTQSERNRFESLNCNSVNSGINPSCNHAWGDKHIQNWRKNHFFHKSCQPTKSQFFPTSSSSETEVHCYHNENKEYYCTLTNVQINFNQFKEIKNPQSSIPKREFQKDFLTIDCNSSTSLSSSSASSHSPSSNMIPSDFKLSHLFSSQLSNPKRCDDYVSGTTLIYSHDNIRNLAHTMNDFMNVWLLLWLERQANSSSSLHFLTIDSMREYNNFNDIINSFYVIYEKNFKKISKAMDFHLKPKKHSIICFEKVILQSLPSRGFVWDHWQADLPCSFIGPSSLFQRWNLHVRDSLGLLPVSLSSSSSSSTSTSSISCPTLPKLDKIIILLVVRSESNNEWGSYRTSRLFLNFLEIKQTLLEIAKTSSSSSSLPPVEILVQDFKDLPAYEDQIELMSRVSIIIAMHGAGIVQSMLMSLGSLNCCGIIEMIPEGEFSPVRGFANMIRKMGFHYHRIAIDARNSKSEGAIVPIQVLENEVIGMIKKVTQEPACILPSVIRDPYLLE
jgi:hypothetical protein